MELEPVCTAEQEFVQKFFDFTLVEPEVSAFLSFAKNSCVRAWVGVGGCVYACVCFYELEIGECAERRRQRHRHRTIGNFRIPRWQQEWRRRKWRIWNLKILWRRLAHCVREMHLNASCTCSAIIFPHLPIISSGNFSNDCGNAKENVIWKSTFAELWLFCNYLSTFEFYNVGEVRFNHS